MIRIVKKKIKGNELELNTYCIFSEEKQDIKETIGLIFKDYIGKVNSVKEIKNFNEKRQDI